MSKPLDDKELSQALDHLKGWALLDDKLVKTFKFSSFREAIGFIIRLSFEAEDMNHHPEIQSVYNRVEISLTTHDAGNRVTEKDVRLAKAIERFSWV